MTDEYNPKTWAADEEITAAGLNQAKDTETYLFNRFLPMYGDDDWSAEVGLGGYLLNADIYPGNPDGTGDRNLIWEILGGGNGASFCIVQFTLPDDCFTTAAGWTKPLILGLTVGAGDPPTGYPWLVATARYDESISGFKQRFGMTNYPPTTFNPGLFNVSGLLVGPRKTQPT